MRIARPAADNPRSPLPTGTAAEILLSSQFLEAIPDAIVAVSTDGTILQVNTQTEELFRYARGELIGQKIEMLVPQRFRGQHQNHRDSFTVSPKTRRMGAGLNLKGRRRDGSEFDVEICLSPVATEDGLIVLSAIRDSVTASESRKNFVRPTKNSIAAPRSKSRIPRPPGLHH
jgi:PAS domain S-box-containing protein